MIKGDKEIGFDHYWDCSHITLIAGGFSHSYWKWFHYCGVI
jgi:hypothetical protein